MNCPQCNQELVHRGPLWMCVECSYAETEQLHDQRLSIGEPEEPEHGELWEPEEEVGREPHGPEAPFETAGRPGTLRPIPRPAIFTDPGFQRDQIHAIAAEPRNWWTTTIVPGGDTVPTQPVRNGGFAEFHPDG